MEFIPTLLNTHGIVLMTYTFFHTYQMGERISWSGAVLISRKHVVTAAHVLVQGYQE